MKIFLYAHGGSGNHGCEAIVRSTCALFDKKTDITLLSTFPTEDIKYGVDGVCRVLPEAGHINKLSPAFFAAYAELKMHKNYIPMEKLRYVSGIKTLEKGDIALSIGGDNYCYKDAERYVIMHELYKSRGAKTVLWGCSVDPSVLDNPALRRDIASYDLITARESLSCELLSQVNPNTVLTADTAFTLESLELPLPAAFINGNTVGVNISPMAMENADSDIVFDNYRQLIRYIISATDMNIALIPHVVWSFTDDRKPLGNLYGEFSSSGRVCMLDDNGCRELKGYIARCRFFVGARTHATIAAYSSGVPTLVTGYSVKAKGIAKDIFGTDEGYVVPVQGMKHGDELTEAFKALVGREQDDRERLSEKTVLFKALASGSVKMLKSQI